MRRINKIFIFFRKWPVISLSILLILFFMASFSFLISPHDPLDHNLRSRNIPPMFQEGGSSKHILGTDPIGRDLLSRLIHGSRISMTVALISLVVGTLVGASLGLIAGYFGGYIDEVITRIVDIWAGLPYILIAMIIVGAIGASLPTMVVLMALIAWSPFVRLVRGDVLVLKELEYISAAKIAGASNLRILSYHLLPGTINTIIVVATFSVGQMILVEAFLSFLGAGIPPPTPAWGSMIADGRQYMRQAWWVSVIPGIAIFLVTASLSLLGDWLRDYFDPKLRQRAWE
jgi:peptide/nickel transport system permease protein